MQRLVEATDGTRLERPLPDLAAQAEALAPSLLRDVDSETSDETAEADEFLPERLALELTRNEVARLGELIALADEVQGEAKIDRLLALIAEELPSGEPVEPVLLFAEYKATQSLVVNAL